MDSVEKVWLRETRHVEDIESTSLDVGNVEDWRKIRERMKTVSVALIFCLNIGVDPPDVEKPHPCAVKEAWIDPNTTNPQKSAQKIALNLQKIYEKLQPRARYKSAIDPTVETIKKLCCSLRKNAKDERVLFHFNGHGVPKPTDAGEIWVFNKNITQYIPLSLVDLQCWMGAPSVYVWDCSSAGTIVNMFMKVVEENPPRWAEEQRVRQQSTSEDNVLYTSSTFIASLRESIQLGACRAGESLPTSPDLPADLFTSCLTSPIQASLLCHMLRTGVKHRYPPNIIDEIPGVPTDRRTLLGELNWIFAAITDTIAWSTLPMDTFQKLFRQDLLVASLFRSFLLAERVMLQYGCHVVSQPAMPAFHSHPFWEHWDYTLDQCLRNLYNTIVYKGEMYQLSPNDWFVPTSMKHNLLVEMTLLNPETECSFSNFFIEQLQAFDVWLMFGVDKKHPPLQLPVLLQVLLSQTHRVRALELLARFVDLGSWAVIAALSVGIFPYVLKLLQCGTRELRPALAFIWAKILAVDPVCQIELIKDNGFIYFLNILNDSTVQSQLKIVPAFVLAMLIYNNYRPAQKKLIEADYVSVCVSLLSDNSVTKCRMLCLWLLIGLGRLWVEYDEARWLATRNVTYERVEEFLDDDAPEVRAAAVYALGCLVHNRSHNNEHATIVDSDICRILCDKCSFDGSVLVRTEFLAAIQWFLIDFENEFLDFHTKLEVEIELTAAKKRKQAALNLSNSSIRRSSSSAANSKHAQKQQQQQQQQTSGVKRKVSLMARNNSAILTPHENSKLRLYEEMKFLEAKTFKTSFERIWLTLLRLCFDSYEQVSSMCLKLVNHILDVSTKRKSERVASLLAERARGAINNPPHRSSNASAGSSVDIVGATVGDGVESASSAAVVGSNNNNVRFMIGSPGAVSAVGATSMIPLVGLPFAAVGHNVSNSAGGATGGTLTAVENLQQQLRECTSVADMVSNGLIETATTNFAPKRNIFGSQSGRYSSSGANPDEEAVTASALLLGNKEIVSTKFVQWCSMLFTQPIYKTIYEDAQSGNTSKTPRGLLVHDADAFTIANLTDWALHTNEGLRQKAVCETEMLKNEKMRCETLHASIHNDRPVTSLAWSYLRPYVYICDGAQVAIHNYRQSKKSCGFSAYTQTLIQDTITDLLPINGRTHELLITGTENGLIQAWDPMFCEHSHEIQDKPKLITTAYVLSDQSRISTQKNAKNRTLYRWDQTFGRLACTGNVRVCRLWDSRAEKGVLDLELKNRNHSVTSVAMDLSVNLVACGFVDGTVKVYDVRLPVAENLLMELRHFTMPIVGSCLHSDGRLTVGSSYGDLRTWEMRMFCEPTVEFHAVNENEASMQQMDVQSTAGIVGCALSNGTVRMFDLTGDQRCVSQMTPFPPPSSSSSAVSRFGLSALTASYATPTATTTKSANAAAAAAATDLFSTLHFHQGQLLLAVGGRNNVYVYGVPAVV